MPNSHTVIPAKAGIYKPVPSNTEIYVDSRFRENDEHKCLRMRSKHLS